MEDLLRKAEEKAKSGKSVSGTQISDIHRLCRRAFSLTPNMKTALAEAALASGWTVIECIGEADVHIGGLTLTDEDVVVSGDSDMLFYDSVQHVLRPMAKMVYHHYSKTDITTLLNLTSVQWTSVGIVSGNDYDPNIWGYGIARNCQIIRSIFGTTVAHVVQKYLATIEPKSSHCHKNFCRAAARGG